MEEKVKFLVYETVNKFLPSVRLKLGNNLVLDTGFYKTNVT